MSNKWVTRDEKISRLMGRSETTLNSKHFLLGSELVGRLAEMVRELQADNKRLTKQSRGRRRAIKCLQANDRLYRTMHGPFIEEYRELRAENKRLTVKLNAMTEKQ